MIHPKTGGYHQAGSHCPRPTELSCFEPFQTEPIPRAAAPDLLADAILKFGWHALSLHGVLQPGAQPSADIDLSGTRRTGIQMPHNIMVRLRRELIAEVGVEVAQSLLASALSKLNSIHALFPS